MKHWAFIILFFTSIGFLKAQSPYVLPGNKWDAWADRWEILYDQSGPESSAIRSRSTESLLSLARSLYRDTAQYSTITNTDIQFLVNEFFYLQNQEEFVTTSKKVFQDSSQQFYTYEKGNIGNQNDALTPVSNEPILKYFYSNPAHFWFHQDEHFALTVNPILDLSYGPALDDDQIIFQNTRGLAINGTIDNKIYFHSSIYENQARFNNFIEERIRRFEAIPGQGFYKSYESGVIDNLDGYDFLNARAYVGINATDHVAIEFGHGNHFIGNGIRSLFLSNYAHNYFYLKFNTRVWKFHYQNLFMELSPISGQMNTGDELLPKKYMANHYLSFRPNSNFEIGLFEAIVFSRENQFEFQYLNPVILYRTVEQFLDSPDNALIGLNAKWNIKNTVQLYGQMILDEFKFDELTAGNGWWANKYGYQAGLKYINAFGVNQLDIQAETNTVRPYTYGHSRSLEAFPRQASASYSHYNQPLAHPLGANFREFIVHATYRPTSQWTLQMRLMHTRFGGDDSEVSNGGNILLNTSLRASDFGNKIAQGLETDIQLARFQLTYEWRQNYFLELTGLYRNERNSEQNIDTRYLGFGFRINTDAFNWDY